MRKINYHDQYFPLFQFLRRVIGILISDERPDYKRGGVRAHLSSEEYHAMHYMFFNF
jgi:hypothetical protein